MYDVMQGISVIEVAEHTFVPAAGMLLADWGADVIKVERAVGGGDAARSLRILQRPGHKRNAFFEVANRGKRSIALDLTKPEGREQLYKLIESADVFTTNLRADARIRMGIEPADLISRNPRLIYARGTGYGTRGALSQLGGFDYPTSWCRSGSGFAQTPASGDRPPQQPGSVGDLTGGATLAGAIAAALFRRERTGKGAIVDHALYAIGMYIMTQHLAGASIGGEPAPAVAPAPPPLNPLNRLYKTSDGRWLNLCFLQDRWFPDLARHIGREELITDPRFATEDAKFENAADLIAILDGVFATRTLAQWCECFSDLEGVWAPLYNAWEVNSDPQALENGFVTEVMADDGFSYLASAPPGQFDEQPVGKLRASPNYAQHTDEVMAQIGLSAAQIEALRAAKVIV